MESLKLSFDALMPIFTLMLLGYTIKIANLADKKTFDAINKLVFKVFLPVLLFNNIYSAKPAEIFDVKLVAFTMLGVLLVFAAGYVTAMTITKDNSRRGVIIQGIFRANYAILGIPLVDYICGDEASGLSALMVAFVVPLFNVLAVISLERFRDGNISVKKLLKGIATNPLIIGCVLGIIFSAFNIRLPYFLENSVNDVAKVATPLAIVTLGASFTFSSIKGYVKETAVIVLAKLIIVPLIMLSAAALFGFRGEALACLTAVFATPIAISSFTMSQQMGGDEKLSAQSVVLSSVLSLVTLFIWIFTLSYMGLF